MFILETISLPFETFVNYNDIIIINYTYMDEIKLSEKLERIVNAYSNKLNLDPERKLQLMQIIKFAFKEGSINGRKNVIKDKVNE